MNLVGSVLPLINILLQPLIVGFQVVADTINYIVESSKSNQGMRDVKRKFEIIVSRVNTLMLTDQDEDIIRLKYKTLYKHYNTDQKPIRILKEHVDVLLTDSVSEDSKKDDPPFGMYI